jgi:hypothetical protein
VAAHNSELSATISATATAKAATVLGPYPHGEGSTVAALVAAALGYPILLPVFAVENGPAAAARPQKKEVCSAVAGKDATSATATLSAAATHAVSSVAKLAAAATRAARTVSGISATATAAAGRTG